jgi:hypothetical protein
VGSRVRQCLRRRRVGWRQHATSTAGTQWAELSDASCIRRQHGDCVVESDSLRDGHELLGESHVACRSCDQRYDRRHLRHADCHSAQCKLYGNCEQLFGQRHGGGHRRGQRCCRGRPGVLQRGLFLHQGRTSQHDRSPGEWRSSDDVERRSGAARRADAQLLGWQHQWDAHCGLPGGDLHGDGEQLRRSIGRQSDHRSKRRARAGPGTRRGYRCDSDNWHARLEP